jgi:predicted transcriptional regulator
MQKNHIKPLLATALCLVIVLSLIAFIQLEKNNSLNINLPPNQAYPAFISQSSFENAAKTQSVINTNSTRTQIYNYIEANPGVQFRGICTGIGIAIGTAEFHLGVLKKAGLISFFRDGKYKRFFANKKFSAKEMRLISLLRHQTTSEILKAIVAQKSVVHGKLALELSISSQALTWQMNRLRQEGIIQQNQCSTKVTYCLNHVYTQKLPELLVALEPTV